MKLKDWADKTGIKYLTAYRWFRAGTLPVKAYQTDSGTIIVQDESETSEQVMGNPQSNDIMSIVLRKTVEFSKANGTVEDFAAWVLSNFSLKLNNHPDHPKYSRQKPKPEEVQKHFQQFLKPKGEKPKPNMFVAGEETLEAIAINDGLSSNEALTSASVPELKDSFSELITPVSCSVNSSYDNSAGGLVMRSFDSTPQINYTSSNNSTFSSNSLIPTTLVSNYLCDEDQLDDNYDIVRSSFGATTFQPTQKELKSTVKVIGAIERPRRGRKPSKKL
jgi:hypothetical protein